MAQRLLSEETGIQRRNMLRKGAFHQALDWLDDVGLAGSAPAYSTPLGVMFNEDSLKLLKRIPSSSIDLVMTSPPFALTRKIRERTDRAIPRMVHALLS
jgi:hypothetical protein